MRNQTFELEVDGVVIATGHKYGYIMMMAAQLKKGKSWAVYTRIYSRFPSKGYKPRDWYDEADKVAEMRAKGVKWADIAQKMDMNLNTLIARFQRHKQYKQSIRGKVDLKAVKEMARDGVSPMEISRLLKVHNSTIYRILKRTG